MADSGQSISGSDEFYENTDRDLVFTHVGNDAATATAIKFVLSRDPAKTALVTKTLGSGIVADSSTQITVSLAKADTAGLGGRTYYWELRLTDATSNEDVIASGTMVIRTGNTD